MVTGYDEEELAGRHEGFCLLKEFKARGQAEAFMESLAHRVRFKSTFVWK